MITTQTIAPAQDGSRTFDAYLARPEQGKAPSIVIFTEMFGIGQHNRNMAEDYARRGFNALIPNLFWRSAYAGELAFAGPDRDAEFSRENCPVQLHYGLKDPHIPQPEIDAVTRAAAQQPNIDIFLYAEAGHSFFNPIRPGYHAGSAMLAGERLDALIDRIFAAAPA